MHAVFSHQQKVQALMIMAAQATDTSDAMSSQEHQSLNTAHVKT